MRSGESPALMLSPSLAVAFSRHSRKSCHLKIEVAGSETNTI